MTRRIIFSMILIFSITNSQGQSSYDLPKVILPSPSALQFQKYGDYPVSNNTGIPPINIPLYTIKEGDLELPISLSYHASGSKPSDINGLVGMGWTLMCGGSITRTIIDRPDEMGTFPSTFYTQAQLNNMSPTWNREYILQGWEDMYDTEPDMFSYHFFGNAGKFFLKRDANLTTLLLPYTPLKIVPNINFSAQSIPTINAWDIRGLSYEFGVTETSSAPGVSAGTRWDLKTMNSPTNSANLITFQYNNSTVESNNNVSSEFIMDDQIMDISPLFGCGGNTPLDLMENYPLQRTHGSNSSNYYSQTFYPSLVTFRNGTIKFIQSSPYASLDRIEVYNNNNQLQKVIKFIYTQKPTNRTLLKEIDFYDGTNTLINKYSFNYNNETYGGIPSAYDAGIDYWGYYNGTGPGSNNSGFLPGWVVGSQIGNASPSYTVGGADRNTYEAAMKTFVLNEIDYPTGGHTVFDYEANKNGQNQDVGGLRIKSISNYESINATPEIKTYEYGSGVIDFYPGDKSDYAYSEKMFIVNAGGGTSGNLAGPWQSFRRSHYLSSPTYNFTPHGSPAVYTEVKEYIGDGQNNTGRTVYQYDYSAATFEDVTYSNAAGVDFTSYASPIFRKRLKFFKDWTTGNLVNKEYDENRNGGYYPVRAEAYVYDFSIGESLRGLYQERFVNYVTACSMLSTWNQAHGLDNALGVSGSGEGQDPPASVYNYADYIIESGEKRLISTTISEWNKDGSQMMSIIKNYEYANSEHVQPTKITQTSSKNETLVTDLKYPHDFISQSPYDEMVNRHIWSPVIEQIQSKNSSLLQATRTNYDLWNNGWGNGGSGSIIVPHTVESKNMINASYETRLRYHAYDQNGNVLMVSKENDLVHSYLWSYNKQYPVAEIVGADYNTISNYVNLSQLESAASDDASLRNLINPIRAANLPNTLVSTYTYKPLLGLTSQTDPSGKTMFYEYDNYNRLRIVRDQDNNILKKFCYNYAGQTINCNESSSQGGSNPSTSIYARLTYENVQYYYPNTIADIVVRFYSDAACTQPVNVNGLTVNFTLANGCYGNTANIVSTGINGNVKVLEYSEYLQYFGQDCESCYAYYCMQEFALSPGNYVIAY